MRIPFWFLIKRSGTWPWMLADAPSRRVGVRYTRTATARYLVAWINRTAIEFGFASRKRDTLGRP